MKPLAFDIETIKDESKEAMLPEPEASKNIKDPEKVKEDIAKKKAAMIDKMGLSPFTGRICSFAVYGEEKAMQYSNTIKKIRDTDETWLIDNIFTLLSKISATHTIITWNGMNFDFPYIYKRAACLSIPLPAGCSAMEYWTRKYSKFPHCDLMQELAGWRREECENLDSMGKLLLGVGKTERDYMYYVDHIKSGKSEKIGVDNLCDAKLTYDLYNKFSPYLFTKGSEQIHRNDY